MGEGTKESTGTRGLASLLKNFYPKQSRTSGVGKLDLQTYMVLWPLRWQHFFAFGELHQVEVRRPPQKREDSGMRISAYSTKSVWRVHNA